MGIKTVETWLKYFLILIGFLLIAFTLYAVLRLHEISTDDNEKQKLSAIQRFLRNRRAVEDECLSVLIANEAIRTLTSPDYPDNYPSNADCQWLLTTMDANMTISLVIDTLMIEPEKNCKLDFLQVYLGSNPMSPSLGPFCGTIKHKVIESNSSTLLLVFHSDVTYEDKGFSINFFTKSTGDCKELLTEGSSTFTSPGFPNNYPDNTECSTVITVEENKKIILNFDSIDLEYGDDCTFDFVQIFDGNYKNSTLLGQICQQTDDRTFESSSSSLLVHFHSDDSVNRKGYRARYSSVDRRNSPIGNCQWEDTEINGTISSPNYPENYPSFANCSMWLLAPEGHRIFIDFEALLLEMESNCSYDFLQITEGPISDSNILGRFCGRISEPKQLVSNRHEVQIQFQSDDFVEFLGFKLRYQFFKIETENEEVTKANSDSQEETITFSVKPRDAMLTVGSSYMLHCNTDYPNAKIRWSKGDMFLAGEKPLLGLKILPNNTLWIQSMSHHLVGQYFCTAVSPEDIKTVTANIHLQGKQSDLPCKLDFRKTPIDSEFEEGEFAHLECLATIRDAPMSWEKDGQLLLNKKHVTILKNGYIFMDRVELNDAGVYTCIAQDPTSRCIKRASAKLKINVKAKIEDICGIPKVEERSRRKRHMKHGKIIGGLDAAKGAYPWQVMLWEPTQKSFCGATLLNERWIVTAAHCLRNEFNIPWYTIRIKLGKHDRENKEAGEIETSISDHSAIVYHPGFNEYTLDNDLALIRMRDRVYFSDHILPVCLGNRNLTEDLLNGNGEGFSPRMGTVIGWGRLKENGGSPRYLQEIKVPLVDPLVCKESTTATVTRNMFCAGYSQEVIGDACKGDSGGPFLMQHADRWYIVGIVSWGEGCGRKNKYGFYTRIANHLSWIQGIIKS